MPARARAALLAVGLLRALAGVAAASTAPGPRVAGCPVFPASNAWNRDVSRAPVDPRSAAYIRSIDSHSNHFLHADFGGGGAYGIPFNVVPRTQPRVPIRDTQRGYVYPARHFASDSRDPNLPPMGLRLRLRASYPLGRFHGEALVILRGLKRYGMVVADNGEDWYVTGASDRRWNDQDLNQLKTVPGAAFEAVRSGAIHRG